MEYTILLKGRDGLEGLTSRYTFQIPSISGGNKDLLYNTGNNVQYLVITYDGT